MDELKRFGLTIYSDPLGPNVTKEHVERSQSIGAEIFAERVDEMLQEEREILRQDAKSIVAWLETFLIRSESPTLDSKALTINQSS